MRGKRIQSVIQFRLIRITPAGAGKTPSEISIRNFWEDHPRRCGENRLKVRIQVTHMGSPPQVRGKLIITAPDELGNGITPAGAGKTLLFFGGQYVVRDHPRRCGENLQHFTPRLLLGGSPPQVRGKHIEGYCALAAARITPAGAGKTKCKLSQRVFQRDHPRRCGENPSALFIVLSSLGSPPQVRGKPRDCPQPCNKTGITPAGAGKTQGSITRQRRGWDHPRRCGENTKKIL